MKVNVTISLEKAILEKAREHAQKQKISFNQLVRNLLTKNVETNGYEVLKDIASLTPKNENQTSWDWNRDEIYED